MLDARVAGPAAAAERVFYCVGFDRAAGDSMRTVYVDGLQNVLDDCRSR